MELKSYLRFFLALLVRSEEGYQHRSHRTGGGGAGEGTCILSYPGISGCGAGGGGEVLENLEKLMEFEKKSYQFVLTPWVCTRFSSEDNFYNFNQNKKGFILKGMQ